MAIAGLQSVSAINASSFHREPLSPLSRRQGDYHDRPSARASSILQIWRQIENEHLVGRSRSRVGDRLQQQQQQRIEDSSADSHNAEVPVRQESGCESADENSSRSEQSGGTGEVERARVRQVFREWNPNGVGDASSVNSSSGAQCPGERARVMRDSVQRSGTCGGREDQGSQAEQVRDGFETNHCGIGATRRIRRLCGRQALLDLLSRAQKDRQKELEDLSQHRPVSNFAYRNRIQSSLRGRFLRTERLVTEERSSVRAAGQVGAQRTKHAVSGLREGFRIRLDKVVPGSVSSAQTDTSSNNNTHDYLNEQTHSSEGMLVIEGISEASNERDTDLPWTISSDSSACSNQSDTSSNTDINDYITEQTQTNSSEDLLAVQNHNEPPNDESDSDRSWMIPPQSIGNQIQQEAADHENLRQNLENVAGTQPSSSSDFSGKRESVVGNLVKNWEGNGSNHGSDDSSGNGGEEHECEQNSNEVSHEQYETGGEQHGDAHITSINLDGYLQSTAENMHWPHTSAAVNEVQGSISDNEDSEGQHPGNMEFTWRENSTEGTDGNWRDNTDNHLYQEASGSEGDEHQYQQELREGWMADERLETLDNVSEEPSRRAAPARSFNNTFFFLDDENVYSTEIGELLNRRNVTNVLQSDFRQSLDLLIQSYAERQANASFDDEADIDIPSPAIVEQNVQHGGSDHHDSHEAERAPFVISSPTVAFSQTFWEREFQNVRWPQSSLHHDFGIEWETINDLRIDMAMLQQRMNSMQRMIESCMDMQIELQRSIRQEVSAALNRDAVSTGNKRVQPNLEPNWDNVRKGICCICSDHNINSLLYRCGHLCTCLGCAERLVKERGRCPMCRAPVVEAVRAYSIQE